MVFAFVCNICGTDVRRDDIPTREKASCPNCRSSVRTRAVYDLVSKVVYGRSVPAREAEARKTVRIIGCTDPMYYRDILRSLFDYTCTFYHKEPFLDIAEPGPGWEQNADVLICMEVIEHVYPPVERAFAGIKSILKPGGAAVITVPYQRRSPTIEHYPGLKSLEILEAGDTRRVEWRDAEGRVHLDEHPVFHGGRGLTLEMRVFGLSDLLDGFAAYGLEAKEVSDNVPEYGIFWWANRASVPILVRRPSESS